MWKESKNIPEQIYHKLSSSDVLLLERQFLIDTILWRHDGSQGQQSCIIGPSVIALRAQRCSGNVLISAFGLKRYFVTL